VFVARLSAWLIIRAGGCDGLSPRLVGSRAIFSVVMARLDRAIQYPSALAIEPRGGGVLGRPVKPGDDGLGLGGALR
jgi:hypothetical protein